MELTSYLLRGNILVRTRERKQGSEGRQTDKAYLNEEAKQ
jgi:hypothetical protein